MKKLYLWARQKVHSPYAAPIFTLLVFIEAFFFMPVNTLLTIYGIEWPKRSFLYALLATVASICGGIVAYWLGFGLCKTGLQDALQWLISPQKFQEIAQTYAQHEVGTVFVLSLLPVPYKVVTLSAGFFKLPFKSFVISIAVARFIRFFGLATALYIWGDKIQKIIDRYFYLFLILTVIILVVTFFFLHR